LIPSSVVPSFATEAKLGHPFLYSRQTLNLVQPPPFDLAGITDKVGEPRGKTRLHTNENLSIADAARSSCRMTY
jgi:hypothetical protein